MEIKGPFRNGTLTSSLTPQELERREQAARRLRERHLHIPYYKKRDEERGMAFWRNFQSGAVLAD